MCVVCRGPEPHPYDECLRRQLADAKQKLETLKADKDEWVRRATVAGNEESNRVARAFSEAGLTIHPGISWEDNAKEIKAKLEYANLQVRAAEGMLISLLDQCFCNGVNVELPDCVTCVKLRLVHRSLLEGAEKRLCLICKDTPATVKGELCEECAGRRGP